MPISCNHRCVRLVIANGASGFRRRIAYVAFYNQAVWPPKVSNASALAASALDDALFQPRELPVVTFSGDGCVMGHWRGVAVGAWGESATLERVAELEKLMNAMGAIHRKFSSVQLVLSSVRLPSAATREALNALTASHGHQVACTATLIEGGGFLASAQRSLLTGALVLGHRGMQNKVFASVLELSTWLASAHSAATGDAIEAAELQQAVTWLRNRLSVSSGQA